MNIAIARFQPSLSGTIQQFMNMGRVPPLPLHKHAITKECNHVEKWDLVECVCSGEWGDRQIWKWHYISQSYCVNILGVV